MQHLTLVADTGNNLPVMADSNLHRYLKEISQYRVLSSKESNEFAIRFVNYGAPAQPNS